MVERLVRRRAHARGRAPLAGDIFNREFRKIGDDWTKRPITLTLAGIRPAWRTSSRRPQDPDALLPSAKQLSPLHEDHPCRGEDRLAHGTPRPRAAVPRDERVKVPREEFDAWFGEVRDDLSTTAWVRLAGSSTPSAASSPTA